MITHLLDLFHLITSFSESIDQPECPQPTLMHSNPHACIQFMRALDHYQQQLRWQKALLITSHLLQQQKKQRLEKGQQFCRQLASLQQISALDRYQKQQQAYYQALCWQLLLLGHFALVLHCSFLLPGLPWPFTHQLSSPAPYQAPISPLAEQRHTKTLTLSLHRNLAHSHPRALVLKKVTLPHLELTKPCKWSRPCKTAQKSFIASALPAKANCSSKIRLLATSVRMNKALGGLTS